MDKPSTMSIAQSLQTNFASDVVLSSNTSHDSSVTVKIYPSSDSTNALYPLVPVTFHSSKEILDEKVKQDGHLIIQLQGCDNFVFFFTKKYYSQVAKRAEKNCCMSFKAMKENIVLYDDDSESGKEDEVMLDEVLSRLKPQKFLSPNSAPIIMMNTSKTTNQPEEKYIKLQKLDKETMKKRLKRS